MLIKKKSTFICLVLLLVLNNRSIAQFDNKSPALPPSPNSSAIIKYSNIPVNLYTGIPGITADLHNFQARGYSFPIILNYHSSGIKVQETASSFGIGWALNVNSMITRVVRGIPDDLTNGYLDASTGLQLDAAVSQANMENIIKGDLDAEPDVFYININGTSGKLVFDKNKNPVYLNGNSIRVINSPFKKELNEDRWILQDLTGNRYYLGDNSDFTETTRSEVFDDTGIPKIRSFVSTWFLSQIITANNFETINYQYLLGAQTKSTTYIKNKRHRDVTTVTSTPAKYITFLLRIKWKKGSVEFVNSTEDVAAWDGNIDEYITNPKYLSAIVSSNEKVLFTYNTSNNRLDLDQGKKLEGIEVRNYKNEPLKFLALNYDYLNSYADGRLNEPNALRLSLKDIELKDKNAANPHKLYAFTYNPIRLPLKNSEKTDHWGYYSNYGDYFMPADKSLANTFKEADPALMSAGSLSKITYETGGFTEFFYESNQYYDDASQRERNAGGLRIASVKNSAQVSDPSARITYYSYKRADGSNLSSGKIIMLPHSYASFIDHQFSSLLALNYGAGTFKTQILPGSPTPPISIDNVAPNPNLIPQIGDQLELRSANVGAFVNGLFSHPRSTVSSSSGPLVVESSISYNDQYDSDGTIVGYSTVTETIGSGNGYTISKFTDKDDYPDTYKQRRVRADFKAVTDNEPPQNPPFTPPTSYSFARGALKEQIVYNSANVAVKKIINTYSVQSLGNSVPGFRCAVGKVQIMGSTVFSSYRSDVYYNIGYYYVLSKTLKLDASEEIDYLPLALSKKTEYQYDAAYPSLLKYEKVTNSNTDLLETEYKYVTDKASVSYANQSETDAADKLYTDGYFAVLLNKQTKNNGQIVDNGKIGYKIWTVNSKAFVMPETIYQGTGSTTLPVMNYYAYDEFGNNLQKARPNGAKSISKWGYTNLYQVYQCQNAEPNEIYAEDFEEQAGGSIAAIAHSGSKSYTGAFTVSFTLPNAKAYRLSYWYYANNSWHYSGFIPYIGPVTLSQGTYIDDVVVIPADAHLTMNAYDPQVGITSTTDSKGQATSYFYDDFKRLSYIKDNDENIIKQFCYNYAGEQQNCYVIDAGDKAGETFYARLELREVNYNDPNPTFYYTTAKMYVRFYSNPECTVPYTLKNNVNIKVRVTQNAQDNYGNYQDITEPEYDAQTGDTERVLWESGAIVEGYEEFGSDPVLGTLFWYETRDYVILANPARNTQPVTDYQPKSTDKDF